MKRISLILVALLPSLAFAHIGADAGIHHGSPFLMGLIHPFTGLDHMAAMITVGIWSVYAFSYSRLAIWSAPVAFASLLLAGGICGFAEASLPIVEPMIATSLLVLGMLVAFRIKLSLLIGAGLVGTFAFFHGIAHGSELPADQALAVLSGMLIGTMSMHIAGMLLGQFVLERNVRLSRLVGASVVLLGLGLLVNQF